MNVKIAMNQQKRRSLSVMFTFLIITTLILIGPAQAVQVNIITEPNNAVAGEDVIFVAEVKIEDQDAYVPITYTNIIFEGPDGFTETCKYTHDTGILECDLDVEVNFYVDAPQGYGYGYSYGYGYGYDFGYGYGYNQGNLFYSINWHTPTDMPGGNYSVKVVAVAEGEDTYEFSSEEETFEIINYCSTMFDMFKDAYNTEVGDDEYRAIFDLNGDGFINIVDFAMFAPFYNNQTWCQEQIEPVEEGYCLDVFSLFEDSYNSVLGDENYDSRFDLNGDDAINIEDFAIFGDNYGDEDWCQNLLEPVVEPNNPSSGGRRRSSSNNDDNETDLSSFIPQDEVLDDFEEDLNSGSGESDVPVEQDAGFLGLTGAAIADVIGGNPWISTLILILLILAFMQLFTSRKPLKGFKK